MFNPIAMSQGRPMLPPLMSLFNQNRAGEAVGSANPASPSSAPAPTAPADSSIPSSQADGENIDNQLQQFRSQDLLYQLMKAIARVSQSDTKANFENDFPDQSANALEPQSFTFELQRQLERSLSFEMSMDDRGFSLDFSYSEQMSSSIQMTSSDENGSQGMSLEVSRMRQFDFSLDVSFGEQQTDPLIIDLQYDGFSFDSSKLVVFDLNADGVDDNFVPPASDDVLLAFDQNQNGKIDNGQELFGDATGFANGFDQLASFDSNGDNQIDKNDPIFNQLLTLTFGEQGQQLIQQLAGQGISQINLDYQQQSKLIANHRLVALSEAQPGQQGVGRVGDFLLSSRASEVS